MRPRHALATLSVLLLIAAGCGPDEPEPQADPADQERIAELEASLAEAEERIRDLEVDNENLQAALEAAQDADEDGTPDEDDPDADPNGDTEPADTAIDPAQQRTAEGLIDQLRARILQAEDREVPDEWEPGSTMWQLFEVPSAVAGTYDTPGEVMTALATEIEAAALGTEQWETTIRVLLDEDDPDLAYGAVLSWGFLDDSVAGRDVRITLTRTSDGRWEPGGAEQRFHCRRGVSDDGEVCV